MKPHKTTKSETGLARIRLMLRTRLEWLHGFPLPDGAWCTVPKERGAGEIIEIERKLVSRTTRAVDELIRDYPRALHKVVGDKKEWEHRHRKLLEMASPISRNKAIRADNLFTDPDAGYPPKVTKKAVFLEKQCAGLQPVLYAFSWLLYLQPELASKALRWVSDHQAQLSVLMQNNKKVPAVRLILQLWRISLDGNTQAELSKQLLDLAGCELVYKNAFFRIDGMFKAIQLETLRIIKLKQVQPHPFCFNELLRRRWKNDNLDFEPNNPYSVLKRVREFTEFLADSGVRTRKRATRLIRYFNLSELVCAWRQWWQEVENTVYMASCPIDREIFVSAQKSLLRRHLEGKVKKLKATRPLFPDKHFFRLAAWLCTSDHKTLLQTLIKVPPLPELNETPGTHLQQRVLYNLASYFYEKRHTLNPACREHYIRRYYRFLGKEQPEIIARRLPQFDHSLFDLKSFASPTEFSGHNVYAKLQSRRHIDTFFGAIEILSAHQHYSSQWFGLVRQFSRKLESPTAVANLVLHLLDGNHHYFNEYTLLRVYSDNSIEIALHLAEQDNPDFTDICDAANELYELFRYWLDNTAIALLETCKKNGLTPYLVKFIQTFYLQQREKHRAEQKLLVKTFSLFSTCYKLKVASLASSSSPETYSTDWINSYPSTFHSVLNEYNALLPNTEKIAANVLGKDFPDHAGMRKELHRLQLKLQDNPGHNTTVRRRLSQRARNLEQYLGNPVEPSPQRLDQLSRRLKQRLLTEIFSNWHRHLNKALNKAWADKLQAYRQHDIVQAFKNYPDLYNLFRLDHALQTLVFKLLTARNGSPPWDLRETRQNSIFLQRMKTRNINMEPWLDGIPAMHFESDGQQFCMQLEDDPLEIFLMGYHFQTCLSPGRENFFATVLNAADINKRIVYVRNKKGTVMGRILIGLTNAGGLVTFHPYSHAFGVFKPLEAFLVTLAKSMHTVILSTGSVEPLMNDDWYNDGPTDLANQFECLKDNSDLRKSLKHVAPEQLVRVLRKALAPHDLNELTLELVINLPEIKKRPALYIPLLSHVAKLEFLSLDSIIIVIKGLRIQIDKTGLTPTLMKFAVDMFCQNMFARRENSWVISDHLPLLARFAPRETLKLVRKILGINAIDQYRNKEYGLNFLFAVMIAYHRLEQPVMMIKMIEIIQPIMKKYDHVYGKRGYGQFIEWIQSSPPGTTYPCWPF